MRLAFSFSVVLNCFFLAAMIGVLSELQRQHQLAGHLQDLLAAAALATQERPHPSVCPCAAGGPCLCPPGSCDCPDCHCDDCQVRGGRPKHRKSLALLEDKWVIDATTTILLDGQPVAYEDVPNGSQAMSVDVLSDYWVKRVVFRSPGK